MVDFSLPIYIFQGGSFDVSNIKIYFFQIFFIQGSPLWFWKTLIENEKSTISVRKKIKTDLKSVGKTLSFALLFVMMNFFREPPYCACLHNLKLPKLYRLQHPA